MHLKIHRVVEYRMDNDNTGGLRGRFIKPNTVVEYCVPINDITTYKANTETDYTPSQICYGVVILSSRVDFLITEEEYERIEKLLNLNNQEELSQLKQTTMPQLNIRDAIQDLQVGENIE